MKHKKLQLAIIGAGIGGLAAASAIQHFCSNIAVNLYERNAADFPQGHALLMTSNGVEALYQLGLREQVLELSEEVCFSRSFDQTGQVVEERRDVTKLGGELGFPFVAMLRSSLHKMLLDRLNVGQIHYDKKCLSVSQDGGIAHLNFEDGESIVADIVILADGVSSLVRPQIFPESSVVNSGLMSCRGIVNVQGLNVTLDAKTSYFYYAKNKRFVSLALPSGGRYWNAMVAKSALPDPDNFQAFQTAFTAWPRVVDELISNTAGDSVIIRPLYDLDPLPNWVVGRVALLGDAAHALLPTLGQGANQALMDAVALAYCLSKFDDVDEALVQYQKKRLLVANKAVEESRAYTKEVFSCVSQVDTHAYQRKVHQYHKN